MNKKNTRAVILRAGLTLSILLGMSNHSDIVSASENIETYYMDNISDEENDEMEIIQEDCIEQVKEESKIIEVEESVGVTEIELEVSEDLEIIHNDSEEQEIEAEQEIIEESEDIVQLQNDLIADDSEENVESEENEEKLTDVEESSEDESDDLLHAAEEPELMTMSVSNDESDSLINVERIYGDNRFKNAVEISKKGWSTAPTVFLANGHKFADSLTGSPLAALKNAPILLTREANLPAETLAELHRLNTKEVIILGGELSVSRDIVNTLGKNGFIVKRIGGDNRYTQAELVAKEIMKVEGQNRDAFLASGQVYSDALSIATIASNKRLPIFLTRGITLEQSVLDAIPYVNSWTIIGGKASVKESAEIELKKNGAKVKRIGGENRYDVNRNVLDYYGVPSDHLYVTSGDHYSDTLPASVLASKESSGVLLINNNNKKRKEEQKYFAQNKHGLRDFTFVGGPMTLSKDTEDDFKDILRTVDNELMKFIAQQFSHYTMSEYNIRLQDALNMQMNSNVKPQTDKRYTAYVNKDYINSKDNTVTIDILNVRSGAGSNNHVIAQLKKGSKVNILNETENWYQIDLRQYWLNASKEDVNYYLNPNNFVLSDRQIFQFLDLTKTTGATANQLNNYLKGRGILEGTGQSFIDAGKKHGINEIYLLSHALLETGHGMSELAEGIQINGYKVHNVFGIGAFDSDPVKLGALKAEEEKWFTPEAAIVGGAKFIGNNYVKAGQNTLYKMRWNPASMNEHGYASHQYATDVRWAFKQVNTMYDLYKSIGINLRDVDIPVYLA